jgi:hypothetical protein
MNSNSALPLIVLGLLCLAPCQAAEPESKTPKVVQKTEQAIERGTEAAAKGVQRGAKATARGVERAADATARGVKAAADGVARGANAAARGVESAADKVKGTSPPASSTGK